jgi:cell division cycle 2-like protein
MGSRWADDETDAALQVERKKEKEEKKRVRAEKQRLQQQQQQQQQQQEQEQEQQDRPSKKRRLSPIQPRQLVRFHVPSWQPARTIDSFERLNHIEEGSYGFVSRARELATGDIVAIKKMKMEPNAAQNGFPVTALREIQTLSAAKHRHIVDLREVVVGEQGNVQDIFLVMDFLEHDLKTLMDDMEEPFLPSEVKTLMLQLGSAIDFLHDRCILHVSPCLATPQHFPLSLTSPKA